MVSTRTATGSIGVLANHAPLMAILEPTELRLYKSDTDVVRFAQGEGYLQVVDNSRWCWWRRRSRPTTSTAPRSRRASRRRARARARRRGLRGARPRRARGQALRGVPRGRRLASGDWYGPAHPLSFVLGALVVAGACRLRGRHAVGSISPATRLGAADEQCVRRRRARSRRASLLGSERLAAARDPPGPRGHRRAGADRRRPGRGRIRDWSRGGHFGGDRVVRRRQFRPARCRRRTAPASPSGPAPARPRGTTPTATLFTVYSLRRHDGPRARTHRPTMSAARSTVTRWRAGR